MTSELCCRFYLPFDDCVKTRTEFEPIKTKSDYPNYCELLSVFGVAC